MQVEKEMELNKMRRSREGGGGGGGVNSVPARQPSTGELLSPRHVHKPSKTQTSPLFSA